LLGCGNRDTQKQGSSARGRNIKKSAEWGLEEKLTSGEALLDSTRAEVQS